MHTLLILAVAAAAGVTVDLSPLVDGVVIPLLVPTVLALGGWAMTRVGAYFHFQISDGQRQVVETAIANGIAWAQSHVAAGETVTLDAKVAKAVEYVLPKIPAALKWLGITPDHLAQLVEARLTKA